METLRNSSDKTSKRIGNISKFAPFLFGALFLKCPNLANAQNIQNQNKTQAEISTSTILDRLDKEIGICLPNGFNEKVLDFVLNDTIMKTKSATDYTENFIINEMKKDRGINKQNQLLFIRSTIYEGISENTLYDRLDDEDEGRSEEYGKALNQINESYENYKTGFKIYMEEKSNQYKQESNQYKQESNQYKQESNQYKQESNQYKQESNQYKQESNQYKQESKEAINSSLENLARFYERYKQDPNTIKDDELKQWKERGKQVIQNCKKGHIDYKAILNKEILEFYGENE